MTMIVVELEVETLMSWLPTEIDWSMVAIAPATKGIQAQNLAIVIILYFLLFDNAGDRKFEAIFQQNSQKSDQGVECTAVLRTEGTCNIYFSRACS